MTEGIKTASPRPDFTVFLVGNPNTGKTTLFNRLTGQQKKTGNLAGVTVTREEAAVALGAYARVRMVDLPGVYSLAADSADEEVAVTAFFECPPDVIVNVVDASNLERNLYLTLQLLELKVPTVVVLSMEDAAAEAGMRVKAAELARQLRVPVISAGRRTAEDLAAIRGCIQAVYQTGAVPLTECYDYLETDWLAEILREAEYRFSELLAVHPEVTAARPLALSTEGAVIRMLERDEPFTARMRQRYPFFADVQRRVDALLAEAEKSRETAEMEMDPPEIVIAESRYGRVAEIFEAVIQRESGQGGKSRYAWSDRIDAVAANRLLGIPVFMLVMFGIFAMTFALGAWPVEWISEGMAALRTTVVSAFGGEGNGSLLCSLVADGLIGGVGGVIVFLPNVIILLFFMALLEVTGYLARVAFLMDALMRRVCGLEGKAIIPLMLGFGCNVPGLMATRTITSEKSRLMTILVLPVMSCGGRLPTYTLLAGALMPARWQAVTVLGIYSLGMALMLAAAKTLSFFLGADRQQRITFVELPPYQMPAARNLLYQVWDYTRGFLVNSGTFILAGAVLMWAAGVFPVKQNFREDYAAQIARAEQGVSAVESEAESEAESEVETQAAVREIRRRQDAERYDFTLAGRIGTALEPVFAPLGFDRNVTLSFVGSIAAKELFVSQMQILYVGVEPENAGGGAASGETDASSASQMRTVLREHYTPLQGVCIMVFALVGVPCLAVVATVRQETKSWLIACSQWLVMTALGWLLTFLIYQGGMLIWN